MRILLVEDNVDHRELMSLALTGHDSTWEVEGVGSGEEAVCLLLGGEVFDLVFLDYSLPQRDGLWFLGEVRRGKAPPPVVMVTGRGDEQVAVEAMKRGAYDYIVKHEGYLKRVPVVAQRVVEANRLALEHRQAEEKLRFYGEIMENMSEGVYLIRLSDGLIVYTNLKFERIFGYEAGEMIGKPVTIVNAPTAKSPEETARKIIEVLNRTGVWYGEINNIKKDGTPFWCYAGCSLFEHPEYGKVIVAVHTDITERKRAEEALQTSKELFEKIFISQMDPIFLLDAINPPAILDCNPAATEVFGYTRQEMAGRTTDFLHVDETAAKKFLEHLYSTLFKRGFLHQFEFQMRRKDGTIFPTEHSVTQLKDEQDKRIGWVNVVRDITERKWSEERILTYQEHLRSLTSELSLIEERERRHIATELHDNISQTLAITKIKLGMAQGLTSSTDWVGSLNEIGELIDQAIQYTRSLTFELSPPILYELGLEAGIEWLTEQIQEKHGIQIGFEDDQQPKPMSEEIRIALFKATKELLINIVKHAQASKAKVSIWREDHSIRIRVEDDGVGFSTSEGKQLRKTTGFGLFNIRERVKYLGGDMVIESEPGRGSRVTLSAPLKEE